MEAPQFTHGHNLSGRPAGQALKGRAAVPCDDTRGLHFHSRWDCELVLLSRHGGSFARLWPIQVTGVAFDSDREGSFARGARGVDPRSALRVLEGEVGRGVDEFRHRAAKVAGAGALFYCVDIRVSIRWGDQVGECGGGRGIRWRRMRVLDGCGLIVCCPPKRLP